MVMAAMNEQCMVISRKNSRQPRGAAGSRSACVHSLATLSAVVVFLVARPALGQEPLTPLMGIEPPSLDFGVLPIGFETELRLEVSNRTGDPM
jgi:hypothetical protein